MSFDLQRFAEFPNTLEKDGDNYLIKTVADLQVLSTCVNAGNNCEGLTFKLANDIDMNGVDFVPIGYVDYRNIKIEIYPFSGTFDGNRHTISNLTINKPDKNYVGLFG
ncbi:MAG: hypothetical protein IJP68_11515, partial [Selenomonadaceae bacterium]|nr:hypothetical protein [Selenomonadaceae bacterium]